MDRDIVCLLCHGGQVGVCTALRPAIELWFQDLAAIDQGRLGGQSALRLHLLQRRLLMVLAAAALLQSQMALVHLRAQLSAQVCTDVAPLISQLGLAVARVAGQLGQFLGVAPEDIPLLVRVAPVLRLMGQLTAPAVSL